MTSLSVLTLAVTAGLAMALPLTRPVVVVPVVAALVVAEGGSWYRARRRRPRVLVDGAVVVLPWDGVESVRGAVGVASTLVTARGAVIGPSGAEVTEGATFTTPQGLDVEVLGCA